ncbi:MAG: cytochrome c peroxidase [Pirellulales bacterium]
MSCAEAGWTYPDSSLNERSGIAPGAIVERLGNRRPPTIGYLQNIAAGVPAFVKERGAYAGGLFYDGRAASLVEQVEGPILNPNEMNNTRDGVVQAVANGPNAALFDKAFGVKPSNLSVEEAFRKITNAIVRFETSSALSPFSSTYDKYVAGEAALTSEQMAGLRLFTGSKTGRPGGPAVKSAGCWTCHTIEETSSDKRDLFTSSTFHNIGTPKNPDHPGFSKADRTVNAQGRPASDDAAVDYGLGGYLYPRSKLPPGNMGTGSDGRGDYLRVNGLFKTPTLRNVDARPSPDFIKRYGHNGYFKGLEQTVRFYNTRNLTTHAGEIINFTEAEPYARLKGKPLWPAPEIANPATLFNPTGTRGMIGNLGLSSYEEASLVAFLKALSDKSLETSKTDNH